MKTTVPGDSYIFSTIVCFPMGQRVEFIPLFFAEEEQKQAHISTIPLKLQGRIHQYSFEASENLS